MAGDQNRDHALRTAIKFTLKSPRTDRNILMKKEYKVLANMSSYVRSYVGQLGGWQYSVHEEGLHPHPYSLNVGLK